MTVTILIILLCVAAVATAVWRYARAGRRKPRKRPPSRYFSVDLTDPKPPATPPERDR